MDGDDVARSQLVSNVSITQPDSVTIQAEPKPTPGRNYTYWEKKTHYTYIINKKKNTNIISVFIKKCKNNHAKIVGSSQRTGIFCSKSLALVKIPKGYIRVLVIILLS